jgi:FkbM family methyltransferase
MNPIYRLFLKDGLDRAARENVRSAPQVACFAQDIIGRKIMIDGVFEKRELLALERFLRSRSAPRETCLDIGANIGNHSLFLARLFDQVIAFEPNSRTFRLLELNAELAPNVRAVHLGLSDRSAELPAEVDPLNIGGARIATGGKSDTTFKVVPLDEYLRALPGVRVDFVKMDVEGHELQALQGGRAMLSRDRPALALEMNIRKEPGPNGAVLDYLDELGYRRAHILRRRTPLVGVPEFRAIAMADLRKLRPRNYKMVLFTQDEDATAAHARNEP